MTAPLQLIESEEVSDDVVSGSKEEGKHDDEDGDGGEWKSTSSPHHVPAKNQSKQRRRKDGNDKKSSSAATPPLPVYRSVVVDANAIIRGAGLSRLSPSSSNFYTVPGVLTEIVDRKAKAHLRSLPFTLQTREPTPASSKAVAAFARLTGDYRSLSLVDLQILALQYELESEGCGGVVHLRTEPKRRLGGGRITPLSTATSTTTTTTTTTEHDTTTTCQNTSEQDTRGTAESGLFEIEAEEAGPDDDDDDDDKSDSSDSEAVNAAPLPKSWASLVNPVLASTHPPPPNNNNTNTQQQTIIMTEEDILNTPFGSMNISNQNKAQLPITATLQNPDLGGQFSDAEESTSTDDEDGEKYAASDADFSDEDCDIYIRDPDELDAPQNEDDDDDDNENYAASDADISDEDCDIYILDPEELEARRQGTWNSSMMKTTTNPVHDNKKVSFAQEKPISSTVFPTLAEAATIPYEEEEEDQITTAVATISFDEDMEAKKQAALKPKFVKEGQHWNSFKKYKNVTSAKGLPSKQSQMEQWEREKEQIRVTTLQEIKNNPKNKKKKHNNPNASRIMGTGNSATTATQMTEEDDDGEGWVSVGNFASLKARGVNGFTLPKDLLQTNGSTDVVVTAVTTKGDDAHRAPPTTATPNKQSAPHDSRRSACATTDFAMQNVVLQMGMRLLSIDGVTVKKVKHWVTRCGTCFTVYGGSTAKHDKLQGRMFCDKCGGSSLERVSASVNAKTGRYRLYLSKHHKKNNTRGTKFSLPKPGQGNRFGGDLLLCEDQLMMGAWHQKVKRGSKKTDSMFGSDIASRVGLGDLTKRSDIHVGFGRRNPNASKFGRERRGKKKKSTEKACGLRRY